MADFASKQPISVVIPTFNGLHLLQKHLPQVAKILRPGDEIVVVDDASNDETVPWLRQQKKSYAEKKLQLTIVAKKKNQRFAAAVNAGVAASKHNNVLLLNNDVTPLSPDLCSKLLAWFTNSLIFSVGCGEVREKTVNAQLFGRGTGAWQRGFLTHYYDPRQKNHATLWTTGGSMMFDKEKFMQLGGFDKLFYPAYEEDRDLSYRALKRGWDIVFDYETRVWHQHETTNQSVFGKTEMAINSWKNQFLIVWKNVDLLHLWEHLLWLPFHLIITNSRTQGALGKGFWRALKNLPQVASKRHREQRFWKRTDREVLDRAMTFAPQDEQ